MTTSPPQKPIPGTTLFDGDLAQKGYALNKMCYSFNSADNRNAFKADEAAYMAKWWCTEQQGKVTDECLQLFGGYGYMAEYPIARLYADARIQRIYGGTTEIMKDLIARRLGA